MQGMFLSGRRGRLSSEPPTPCLIIRATLLGSGKLRMGWSGEAKQSFYYFSSLFLVSCPLAAPAGQRMLAKGGDFSHKPWSQSSSFSHGDAMRFSHSLALGWQRLLNDRGVLISKRQCQQHGAGRCGEGRQRPCPTQPRKCMSCMAHMVCRND